MKKTLDVNLNLFKISYEIIRVYVELKKYINTEKQNDYIYFKTNFNVFNPKNTNVTFIPEKIKDKRLNVKKIDKKTLNEILLKVGKYFQIHYKFDIKNEENEIKEFEGIIDSVNEITKGKNFIL